MSVIGFFSDKSDAKAQLDAFNAVHCDHFEYDGPDSPTIAVWLPLGNCKLTSHNALSFLFG